MKKFDFLNSKPRHILCMNDAREEDFLDDQGDIWLFACMVYHVESVKTKNSFTVVQLKELPDLWFNSDRFTEVEYSKNFSDFNICDPRMRHIVCVRNQEIFSLFNDHASNYLKVEEIYHVLEVEAHESYAKVRLLEFQDLMFHSMNFSEISIIKDN